MMKTLLTRGHEISYARATHLGMGMRPHVHTIYRCHFTHLTYLTLTTYPSHPTPPPNHRFDDDDDDFDPDRLAHYDALACGIVSVQRARLMP